MRKIQNQRRGSEPETSGGGKQIKAGSIIIIRGDKIENDIDEKITNKT